MDSYNRLERFGFSFKTSGTHTRRTIMLDELSQLLAHVNIPKATKEEYFSAIIDDNCLNKQTSNNRKMSATYLAELYSLDLQHILFRSLIYFWQRDEEGRPLLAMLCAYSRDAILSASSKYFLSLHENELVNSKDLEVYLERQFPGRWSNNTLASIGRNLKASWTKSGHFTGFSEKTRTKAIATPGATAYVLLLGYLSGHRGQSLFQTEYARLLDRPVDSQILLAAEASRRGWITLKHIGDVIEVNFPNLITKQEMEWVYEQN